jgi:hypothetical protein
LLVCSVLHATQDVAITQKEVRDPRVLATWLVANAQDAETRLVAAGATSTSTIVLTNAVEGGSCSILLNADQHDDAGDMAKVLLDENGLLSIQTDYSSKGTLATKLSMDATGIVTMMGGATLDNTASAAELNITETTVKITGALTSTGLGTFAGLTTGTGEATVDGKYAVVGGDASTGLMIQKGGGAAVTNGITVTFAVAFGAAPTVIISAAETTTAIPWVSSVTTTNFVVNGTDYKANNWVAVGTRP